jgi:hypothetical protein
MRNISHFLCDFLCQNDSYRTSEARWSGHGTHFHHVILWQISGTRGNILLCILVDFIESNSIDRIVFPEWAIEDDGCRTPDRGVGTCISIQSCKPMMDVLEVVPQPLPPKIVNLLKSYQCGYSGTDPKVCCPKTPIKIDGVTSMKHGALPQPPDVSKHRNLNLLPQECGHLDTGDRIINGNKTGLFEFPWMALLSYRTSEWAELRRSS